ncbi:MAG: alanine racemase [Rubricoccaceae bacterium]
MLPVTAPPEPSTLRAEIDLGALRHNARVLAARVRAAGADEMMAVVKADAYGHGASTVAAVLAEEGVQRFAVASVREGIALREAGRTEPILVLAAPLPENVPAYVRHDLGVTVTSEAVAEAVIAAARTAGPLTAHVKVDTGMHRIGLAPAAVPDVVARLQRAPGVFVEGLMTHLATVDEAFTHTQMATFDGVLARLPELPPLVHVANSGTLLHVPETARGRSLARVGGALFGLLSDHLLLADAADLRPVLRLVGRVVHLQTVPAGETVSYGRTWRAAAPTRVATVAAGYGDGVPRQLSGRGRVGVRGALYPIAGRVCMDMLMLELGPPDGPGAAVRVGDEAVLLGPGGPDPLEVARAADTITYALTCGLTARVPRVYLGPGPARADEALAVSGTGANSR